MEECGCKMIIHIAGQSDGPAKLLNPHGITVFHSKGEPRKHYGFLQLPVMVAWNL